MTDTALSPSDAYFAGQEARLLRDLERPKLERLRKLGRQALIGLGLVGIVVAPAILGTRMVANSDAEPKRLPEASADGTSLGDGLGEVDMSNRPEVLGTLDLGTHESGFRILREVFVTSADQEPEQEAFAALSNMMTSVETGSPQITIETLVSGPSSFRYIAPEAEAAGRNLVAQHTGYSGLGFRPDREAGNDPLAVTRTLTESGSILEMNGPVELTGSRIPGMALRRADETLASFNHIAITMHTQPDGSEIPTSIVFGSGDPLHKGGG